MLDPFRRAVVCLAAMLLFPTEVALAVTTTGRVTGQVMDPTGLPVDMAQVSLVAPELIGGARTTQTGPEGEFAFTNLPAGTYTLDVRTEGFRHTQVQGVQVETGRAVSLEVLLDPPSVATSGPAVITAAPPNLDTEQVALGLTLNTRFLNTIWTTRDYRGASLLAPGVHDGNNEAEPGPTSNLFIHGANRFSNRYLLDGFNMTDPVDNSFALDLNFDAIEDIQVLTAGRDAEFGGATGGVINVVTKSGGNRFMVDGSIYVRPDLSELARRDIISGDTRFLPEGISPYRRDDPIQPSLGGFANLNLGGPIIKDRLWFFVSNQLEFGTSRLAAPSVFPGEGEHPAREVRAYRGLAKLTYQARPWQRFQFVLQGDPESISNILQSPLVHPDSELRRNGGGALVGASSDTNLGSRVLWKNRLGLFSGYNQLLPESGDLGRAPRENVTTGTLLGNAPTLLRDTRNRVEVGTQVVISWELLGTHETRVGGDAWFAWNRSFSSVPGGVLYRDVGVPANLNEQGVPLEQVRVVAPENYAVNGDSLGLYIQDVWKPFRSLTIRPGIRIDSTRMRDNRAGSLGALVANPVSADGVAAFLQNQVNAAGNVFDATVLQLNAISPRIGVAWDPFNDGTTNIHAGFYRYTDNGMLLVPARASRNARTQTLAFNSTTGAYDIPAGSTNAAGRYTVADHLSGFNPRDFPGPDDVRLNTAQGLTIQGWDPLQVITGHHVPKTDEIILGVTREITSSVSLSVDAIGRVMTNLYEDDETNLIWNDDGSAVIDTRDGSNQPTYRLGTPDAAYRIYYGFDVLLRKRLTDRFEGLVSYTFGITRGTTNFPFSYALDNEKQLSYVFGNLDGDRRHILRAAGSYRLPLGFLVGGSASFLSGLPYDRLHFNQFFADYTDLRAHRGYDPSNPNRELRLPDLVLTNARVMWDAESLTEQKLWFIMDVQNMLNLRTATSVEQRNLPEGSATQFGDVVSRQQPVQITFGARFQY